jgi:hypothetical protein
LMPGSATRNARRTERYLDGLVAADERRAAEIPVDTDMDPAIRVAARQLRAGLVRVHPSFRFEEALAARLAAAADRMKAGLPAELPPAAVAGGTLAAFRGTGAAAADLGVVVGAAAGESAATPSIGLSHSAATVVRGLTDVAARPRRPLIVGGVGVASAAISLGAVYVAWRHSHPTSGRMSRAVRAAHGRASHSGRRGSGVINEILGVVS